MAWWLAPLAAGLIYAAAMSPWASQRLPRLLLPMLAATGAVLIVWALVRSLVRLVRARRSQRSLQPVPVVVNAIAALVLVVSPAFRLVGVMVGGNLGAPRTIAGFGDWRGGEGYPRLSPHRGVDIAASVGSDALAAADGRVVVARDTGDACGLIVVIVHDPHGYRTVYCHLASFTVAPGQHVSRGQRIGAVGTTGQRAWPGYEHVHLELQRGGDPNDLEDPATRLAGCFDGSRPYTVDRLLLTYPVRC
jgi:murein DD-endopeptidase MepM/ murein hydrolase activator NlpD